MPGTKRRKKVPTRIALGPEAIEAWQEGDNARLVRALELRPWHRRPWPKYLSGPGVDPDHPPAPDAAWDGNWAKAVELQRELYAIAGPPPRKLKDAEPVVVQLPARNWRDTR